MALTLKVMTYNIKSAAYSPGGLDAVARVLAAESPDLAGLQEVDRGRQRSGFVDQTRWLAERLSMPHFAFGPSFETDEGSGRVGGYGNAVLSRYPIVAVEVRQLYRPDDWRALGAKWPPEPRSVLATAVRLGEAELAFFCTHLGLLAEERVEQAKEIRDFIQGWREGTPVVLVGDFNATPGSPELMPLRAVFRSAVAAAGLSGEARYTFPSGPVGSRTDEGWGAGIDDIFLGPGVKPITAAVVNDVTRASDHNPIVATIALDVNRG